MSRVFISYRHEDEAHARRVRDVGLRLRQAGLTVVLDQFAQEDEFHFGGPPDGWPSWCERQAADAGQRILVVASPGWFARYRKDPVPDPGTGLGVAAEAHILRQRLSDAAYTNTFFRVVCLAAADRAGIPEGIKGYHVFSADTDFEKVVAWLKGAEAGADPVPAGWLAAPPEFHWPVANCDDVRDAFSRMLTEASARRVLLVRGPGEVGKSHLTRLLLNLGIGQAWLACGRFDLRGLTGLDREFSSFVTNLGVDDVARETEGRSLTQRLDAVLVALRERAGPALLIFDTFDAPGEGSEWLETKALLTVPRAPWLRVVIAGQHVPPPAGRAWAGFAGPVIALRQLTWKDWHEYGRENGKAVTEDFVQKAFELAEGRHALLDQLLGPTLA